MKETKTLLQHIQDMNRETEQWVLGDPKNRWACLFTEDLEHWEGYGITTVEEFDHYLAETEHWEIYRSIHGIKPRWMNYKEMTTDEIKQEIERELEAYKVQLEWEKEQERLRKIEEEEERKRFEAIKKAAFDVEGNTKEMHSLGRAFGEL